MHEFIRRFWLFSLTLALVAGLPQALLAAEDDDIFEEGSSEYEVCEALPADMRLYVGERMEYVIRYLGMKAGEAIIEVVGKDEIEGREAYHLRGLVRSTGLYRSIYPADLRYNTWLDAETFEPIKAYHYTNYSKYHDEKSFVFNPDQNVVHRERKKYYHRKKDRFRHYIKDYEFRQGMEEEFGTLFRLRSLDCGVGSQFDFHIYSDKANYPVAVRVINERELDTRAGDYETKVFEPIYLGEAESDFAKNTRLQMFYGTKGAKPLVKVKLKLWLGSLTAELESYTPGELVETEAPKASLPPFARPKPSPTEVVETEPTPDAEKRELTSARP